MTKFFNRLKKLCFWPISGPFSNFGGKKNFPRNPALSRTISYGILAPCQNIGKLMTQFQENARTDEMTEGRMEGQMDIFYRTLPANAGGPTSATAVDHI